MESPRESCLSVQIKTVRNSSERWRGASHGRCRLGHKNDTGCSSNRIEEMTSLEDSIRVRFPFKEFQRYSTSLFLVKFVTDRNQSGVRSL
jgi:hypothetical protein